MTRISSSVGLVSGINTSQLITQLLQVEGLPITDLQKKVTAEQKQQSALGTLQSQIQSLHDTAGQLKSFDTSSARLVNSSDATTVTATASSGAALGTYQITPIRLASTQQSISNGFADASSTKVGAGTIVIKQGGFLAADTSLNQLNGGAGVARGKFSITDRSGATATIDLSAAQTITDVVNAINNASGIRVRATLQDDRIVLADQTGQTTGNLSVQDLGTSTTAKDLGLAQSVGTSSITGSNINRLSQNLQLSYLNDGLGVQRAGSVPDFRITAKDGTAIDVTLGSAATVQDALNAINTATGNSGKVTASIAPSGTSLVLTDNTGGGGTLNVASLNASQAANDLGLAGNEQGGGVLTGGRVLAGLGSTLLKDLKGGSGVSSLGTVQLTDRTGATATVDLSSATSVSDVITAINGAGIGLQASINSAGDGIQVTDTTTGTGNLQIADVTGTAASSLNLTANSATNSVNSGDLKLRYVSTNTTLASLNNGAGVPAGKFTIINTAGNSATIDLTGSNVKTVGDVIQAINTSGINVAASINSTGDGILLTDSAGGTNQLQVVDLSGGTTASSLHLLGAGATQIDGSLSYKISVGADDTLNSIISNLKASGAPVAASLINDGSSSPYRLVLNSTQSGAAGRLLIDTGASGLQLSQVAQASNAVLGLGQNANGAPALLFSSSSNTFSQVAANVSVTIQAVTSTPVTLSVVGDTSLLANQISNFVQQFNAASTSLTADLAFDPSGTNTGPLQGDVTTLQVQDALNGLFGYVTGNPDNPVQTLAKLGISYKGGQLSLDQNVLSQALQSNASNVQDFFSNVDNGFAYKLQTVSDQLSNGTTGRITYQTTALNTRITDQQAQIANLQAHLAIRQTQLQTDFNNMETALSTLQSTSSQLTQLANLASLAQLGYSSSGSSSKSSSSSSSG